MSNIDRPITINEMMTALPDEVRATIDALKARAEKAEALNKRLSNIREELMAELERARPLLEEVEKVDMEGVMSYYDDTMKLVYDGLPVPEDRWDFVIGNILRAALAYKEQHER